MWDYKETKGKILELNVPALRDVLECAGQDTTGCKKMLQVNLFSSFKGLIEKWVLESV